MIKSSPILPIRFYDSLFDQQRFNSHSANADQVDLVYPAHELPHFQLRRTKSLNTCTKFYLRNICTDQTYNYGYYKQIPVPADNFSTYAANNFYTMVDAGGIYDDGVASPIGRLISPAQYSCNRLVNVPLPDAFWTESTPGEISFPLIGHPQVYTYKIVVDKFKNVSTGFSIKIYNGTSAGTLLATITDPGIYTYTFTSTANKITVVFDGYNYGDLFEISYMQASVNIFGTIQSGSDVVLTPAAVKIKPMLDGTDILYYCDPVTTYNPASGVAPSPGYYYFIIEMGPDEYYFSEVFRIVTLREIEKYYRLKWSHTCDINNSVLYSFAILATDYYNTLYLEAALFNPEPETKEEGNDDGEGVATTDFKGWQKFINLEILKCPEFLSDALSGVFLHDNVYLKKPLNINQEVNNNDLLVRKIVPEVSSILKDHFQKVNLRLLIEEALSVTGCCNEADTFTCNPERYSAAASCTGDYRLQLTGPPTAGDGLYECASGLLIDVTEEELIKFGGKYYKLTLLGGIYQPLAILPCIDSTATVGLLEVVEGQAIPHSFVKLQYNKNSAGWIDLSTVAVDGDGNYEVSYPNSLHTGAIDLKLRIQNISLLCNFGFSDVFDAV